MAKEDEKKATPEAEKLAAEIAAKEAELKAKADAETKAKAEAEAKAKTDAEKAKAHEGLVKMHKDGKHIHAHPTTIHDHEKNGWKRA